MNLIGVFIFLGIEMMFKQIVIVVEKLGDN